MIVMKFGGTSNENAAVMRNVVRIVKSHLAEQPIVVISAIARATNELEQIARTAALGDQPQAEELVKSLFRRHDAIIADLITISERARQLTSAFALYQRELSELVKGISILKELTPRTMDSVCSYGERISSRIISAALEESGVRSVWVDAKEFMLTDDNFGRAQPLIDKVRERLEEVVKPLLAKGDIPVTQGFIGVTLSGNYTTMGRESSDYSASIIGSAMNARKVQIWTDVDGILTADPRIVQSTKKVKRMSFEEAFELSYFGAKVLHPTTMLPVLEKKIPVQIMNSRREQSTGTLVEPDTLPVTSVVKSIAHRKNVSVVTVLPHRRFGQYVFWEGIFSVLTKYGVSTSLMATSEYNVSLLVDDRVITSGLSQELGEFGKVEVQANKGSISIVGKGLRANPKIINRIFRSVGDCDLAMVSYGASDSSMTIVVEAGQIAGALKLLHREFFDNIDDIEAFDPIGE